MRRTGEETQIRDRRLHINDDITLPKRFDLSVEPVFAVMALYDARERKKISESFHLDCNPSELLKMVDDNHSSQERTMASLSRSAIFNVSYPNPDVYLVIKVSFLLNHNAHLHSPFTQCHLPFTSCTIFTHHTPHMHKTHTTCIHMHTHEIG